MQSLGAHVSSRDPVDQIFPPDPELLALLQSTSEEKLPEVTSLLIEAALDSGDPVRLYTLLRLVCPTGCAGRAMYELTTAHPTWHVKPDDASLAEVEVVQDPKPERPERQTPRRYREKSSISEGKLSLRETSALLRIGEGSDANSIAWKMGISEANLNSLLRRAMYKLGVSDLASAICELKRSLPDAPSAV